jgi:hypothetical protein
MIFLDIDSFNRRKGGKVCSGDVFVSRRAPDNSSVCAVLADGLGSGLQANTAASLTATMALEYISANVDIRRAAEMIMDALPLCPERHIPYSTFTMVRAEIGGNVRLIEYGNPPALLFRGTEPVDIPRTLFMLPRWGKRDMKYATFDIRLGDRLVFCSDGVTQSAMGSDRFPFGWGSDNLARFITETLRAAPATEGSDLTRAVVEKAQGFDNGIPGDDITCNVLHDREARVLQVLTGPPYAKANDHAYASQVLNPGAKTVICGGTTAEIVGRELGREIDTSLANLDPDIPATSMMEGVELVTEGCITLSACAEMLQSGHVPARKNGATQLYDLFVHSDRIVFMVGTGINPAHQDPKLPKELEIRRTLIRRLKGVLEEKYTKQVVLQFF